MNWLGSNVLHGVRNRYKDGTIKIRDFHSGQLRKILKAHGKSVLAMAVSPDGLRLVSSGEDRMLKIWDLQSSKLLKQIKDAHQGVVQQIAINPDNQTFATRGYLGTEVKIWDLERGNEILSLEGHTKEIAALAIAPDGQTLVSSGKERQIKVWDYQQGRNIKTWDIPKPLHSLAITSDGQRLVGGNYLGRRVSIWDINSGKLLQSFKGNDWEVRGISPENQKIVVGRYQVEILALNGKLPPQRLGGSWQIRTLAIASDNQTLITGNVDSQIAIWDLASKSLQRTLKVTSGNIESLAISSDRQTLAVGTSSGALEIWDYPRGEQKKILQRSHSKEVQALAITPDGRRLLTGSWNDSVVGVWDLRQGKLLSTLKAPAKVFSLAISPDGQMLYVGTISTVDIWNLNSREFVGRFNAHSQEVQVLAASSDGKLLITGGMDKADLSEFYTIKVWHPGNLKLLQTLKGYSTYLNSLFISPNGRLAIFTDCCKTVFWDWRNNIKVGGLDGIKHNTVLGSDGNTLVSVGDDRETIAIANLDSVLPANLKGDR